MERRFVPFKLSSAVSVPLVALALAACGDGKITQNPTSEPQPTSTPTRFNFQQSVDIDATAETGLNKDCRKPLDPQQGWTGAEYLKACKALYPKRSDRIKLFKEILPQLP